MAASTVLGYIIDIVIFYRLIQLKTDVKIKQGDSEEHILNRTFSLNCWTAMSALCTEASLLNLALCSFRCVLRDVSHLQRSIDTTAQQDVARSVLKLESIPEKIWTSTFTYSIENYWKIDAAYISVDKALKPKRKLTCTV